MSAGSDHHDRRIDELLRVLDGDAHDDRQQAAESLVEELRRRREPPRRSARPDEPPRRSARPDDSPRRSARPPATPAGSGALLEIADAVRRLRVQDQPQEVLRGGCADASRVSGLECVAFSAIRADGELDPLFLIGGVGGADAAAAVRDGAGSRRPPRGPAEDEAIRSGCPVVSRTPTAEAGPEPWACGDDGYTVVPVLRSGSTVGVIHGAHLPSRPPAGERVAALSAFAAVLAPLWQRAALQSQWQLYAARSLERVASVLDGALAVDDDLPLDGIQDDLPDTHPDRPRACATDRGPHAPDTGPPHPSPGGGGPGASGLAMLTSREREVREHLLVGAGNREIAEALVLSVETVKSHVKSILRKLGAANRAELISQRTDR